MYSMSTPTINVNYDRINVLQFFGAYSLSAVNLPAVAGLYVIMAISPINNLYDILYVGQTGDLSERGFPRGHHAYPRWIKLAAGRQLFIAYAPLASVSDDVRRQLEAAIIRIYNPPANRTLSLFPTLPRRY